MKTIELTTPINGPRGEIRSLNLRDPKYRDYMQIGLPVQWVSVSEGGGFEQETPALINEWVERICEIDPNLLQMLSLRDTLALRDAVLSFFREARMPPTISESLPGPSSSDSTPTFEPSKI